MKQIIVASLLLLFFFIIGISFKQSPYELSAKGRAYDQMVLDHKDSPYSHISWIASETGNYAQLRFFDKVEGGVCLKPSWEDIIKNKELAHLGKSGKEIILKDAGAGWKEGVVRPNPGTLTNTKYVNLYPASILLNNSFTDHKNAPVNILIVGLGSGIGISVFAHHFPEASIRVVDIDQSVVDLVDGHYPFLQDLQNKKTKDGRVRLSLNVADARQFIKYEDMRNDKGIKYDVVILDAYTSGSTIPSHLMTEEFYSEIAEILTPSGIFMSNIISSYTGKKRFVLGGAMKSLKNTELEHIHNFPILSRYESKPLNVEQTRNNMLVASRKPLSPKGNKSGWERLKSYKTYPELKTNTYFTNQISTLDDNGYSYSPIVDIKDEVLLKKINLIAKKNNKANNNKYFIKNNDDEYSSIIDETTVKEEIYNYLNKTFGKDENSLIKMHEWLPSKRYYFSHTDWVLHSRRTFERSIVVAKTKDAMSGLYAHSAERLVGIPATEDKEATEGLIKNSPVFTDARPNADILNR